MPRRLSVRTVRTFSLSLSDRRVTLRRVDLMNQWLLGKVDESLLTQVYAAERVFGTVDTEVSTLDGLAKLSAEDRRALLDGLRRFACVAVVEPRFACEEDGDLDAEPVEDLAFQDLMQIWNATPPAQVAADPDQPLAVPTEEGGRAEARFPEPAAGAEPPVPARPDPAGTGGARAAVAVSPDRTPYHGLVSLTTH